MRNVHTFNVNDTNTYTQQDIDILNSLIVKEAYPELYNNNNFETIEFTGFCRVEEGNITTDLGGGTTTYDVYGRSQQARLAGGATDEEDEQLEKSYTSSGTKLFLPPPAYYTADGTNHTIITGHRRNSVHKKYNFTNRIASQYVRKSGFTDEQVASELSALGNIWNPKEPPAVSAKQYDIEADGIRAVDREWIEHDLSVIYDRLKPQAKAAGIGETKLTEMTAVVFNATLHKSKTGQKPQLPMGEERASEWLANSQYKNLPNKIEYKPLSYSTWGKNFSTLMIYAKKNPDVEIRVVVHAATITKGKEEYDRRVARFYNKMHEVLDAVAFVTKVGKPLRFGNIVLYGAIPQLPEFHDLTKLNLFLKDGDGEYYQK